MSMLSHGGILILLLLLSSPGSLQTSFKCKECGKLLQNEQEIQMHATRTGHSKFTESTDEVEPLTAKEKAAQLARLEEAQEQKVFKRKEREWEELLENENKRKTGQELSAIRKEARSAEAVKITTNIMRKKTEAKERKKEVLDQIARDRAEIEAEQLAKKQPISNQPRPPPQPVSSISSSYDKCRLQFRCKDGRRVVKTFHPTDTWDQVLHETGMKDKTFMTTYPKKVYGTEEGQKTLQELGLVPSSALMETYHVDNPMKSPNVFNQPLRADDKERRVNTKPFEFHKPVEDRIIEDNNVALIMKDFDSLKIEENNRPPKFNFSMKASKFTKTTQTITSLFSLLLLIIFT